MAEKNNDEIPDTIDKLLRRSKNGEVATTR